MSLTRARGCSRPNLREETLQAANQQSSALGRLLAVAENYPQLRANEQFNRLMDELSGTENRLAVARMRYNETVQVYNTQRRKFPSNVTAKVFGFKEYPYWEVPPEAKVAPKVNFGGQVYALVVDSTTVPSRPAGPSSIRRIRGE